MEKKIKSAKPRPIPDPIRVLKKELQTIAQALTEINKRLNELASDTRPKTWKS